LKKSGGYDYQLKCRTVVLSQRIKSQLVVKPPVVSMIPCIIKAVIVRVEQILPEWLIVLLLMDISGMASGRYSQV
jgi:hypothetical protein